MSDIKIFNAALSLLGVPKVGSFLENSSSARVGNQVYADTLEDALSTYPWRFCQNIERIYPAAIVDVPPQWESIWVMPEECLNIRTVRVDGQIAQFDVFGRHITLNIAADTTATVIAEFTVLTKPSNWAPYFRAAFIAHLCSVIAMPITQDERTAAYWQQQADIKMRKAKTVDAQGRTPARIDTKMFIRARLGGRR